MKKTRLKRLLSFLVCTVLIAAMALFTNGCSDKKDPGSQPPKEQTPTSQGETAVRGKGAKIFNFTVTSTDGKETVYEIHTDKATVGEALLELDLIAGEEGSYGLYVKTVDGITLDYDKDGLYWAFYENDVYASQGVDTTEITEGASYAFKPES